MRYCKSNESESRALFSLKYHRLFERFFAVLACWRDNSPSQAKVHKANQKIKEANVRTTEVSKKIHITKWNIRQLSDCKMNTRCHSGVGPPPPQIWIPRSRSASGFGPPGPNPLADMNPLSRIWTPLKTSVLLSKIGKIVFWSCQGHPTTIFGKISVRKTI